MRALIRNPFFIGYVAAWLASASVLALVYGYGPVEPVAVLVIFGLLLPGLALLLTRDHAPRAARLDAPAIEARTVLFYLLPVTAFLAWGFSALQGWVPDWL